MNSRIILGAVAIVACLVSAGSALGQASIDENQKIYLYVNGSTGSNSNPGTSAKPFKTIQAGVNKAIADAKAGIGTHLMIYPGTYRETVTLNYRSNVPITVQAMTPGKAIIDGTNVLTNWYKVSTYVYGYTWKDTVTGCPLPAGWYTGMPPVVQANEMVFVNGAHMTQVMSTSQLRAGTFYVEPSAEKLEVYPPSGTDMATAQVLVSARRATLNADGSQNLVFRGLVLQHAASCLNQTGATIGSSNNILIDDVQANWNNFGALGVNNSTKVTVENTTASYNGGAGLSGYEDLDSRWQNNETDYNNWRGAMVGLYDFAQGGTKLMRAHTATVTGQKSYNNQSQGLWFDTDNMNITISSALLVGNIVDNLQLEASQGPFTISNSTFCSGGAGLNLVNAGSVSLSGSHFYNNLGVHDQNAQVYLSGNPGGRIVTNWQNGAKTNVYTKDAKVHSNTFTAVGSGQYVFDTYVSGTDWAEYIDSLESNDNHWYNASKPSSFGMPAGKSTNFSGWKSTSKQDYDSAWSLASTATTGCGGPAISYPDFQIMAHNAASYVSGYTMTGGKITIPLQIKSFKFGTVKLSVSGLPSGVTASFSTSSLVSGNPTMTLHASTSAAYETVPITIFAISGSRVHTLTLKIAVRPS
jgi:hypothetical protein